MPMVRVSNGGTSKSRAIFLGNGTGQGFSTNISNLVENYASATINNFVVQTNSIFSINRNGTANLSKSYNASTGAFSCSMWYDSYFYATSISVYYVEVEES